MQHLFVITPSEPAIVMELPLNLVKYLQKKKKNLQLTSYLTVRDEETGHFPLKLGTM